MTFCRRTSLARVRTELANQRTFLSFTRTGFAAIMGGLVMIHYFRDFHELYMYLGFIFLAAGIIILIIGIKSTFYKAHEIHELENREDQKME